MGMSGGVVMCSRVALQTALHCRPSDMAMHQLVASVRPEVLCCLWSVTSTDDPVGHLAGAFMEEP